MVEHHFMSFFDSEDKAISDKISLIDGFMVLEAFHNYATQFKAIQEHLGTECETVPK